MKDKLNDERLVRRVGWSNGVLLAVLTVGAGLFFSIRSAGGVLLGGIISILSYEALKWQLQRAFRDPAKIPGKGRLFVSFYLRFLGMAFLVFVAIYYKWVHPVPFLAGLSVVVISITWVGIAEYFAMLQRGER